MSIGDVATAVALAKEINEQYGFEKVTILLSSSWTTAMDISSGKSKITIPELVSKYGIKEDKNGNAISIKYYCIDIKYDTDGTIQKMHFGEVRKKTEE